MWRTMREVGLAGLISLAVMASVEAAPVERTASISLSGEALRVVRLVAIQHNGRYKPFDSFARETLQSITGEARFGHEDVVNTVLSIMADSERWQGERLLAVPFRPLRERLGMDLQVGRFSYNELVASRKLMRMLPAIVEKQQRNEKLTMLEQETMDAYERFVTLNGLFQQDLTLVPPASGQGSWVAIMEATGYSLAQQQAFREAWTSFLEAAKRHDDAATVAAARHLAESLRQANPAAYPPMWRLQLEVGYHLVAPFRIARVFYLLAALVLWLGMGLARRGIGLAGAWAFWIAFSLHVVGIAARVAVGGRPPVSNFYETMLWLPFVAVGVAAIFDRVYRVRYFRVAGSILAAITLWLADIVPLDSSIAPVVAVLRSNLWLTVHVLTIVASYGALALATVLAHLYSVQFLATRQDRAGLASLDLFLYRTLQVGVVLLAAGIMLGAVWANASWGRYWGWDPKETWALITLLWFLAVLHGRFAGWLKGITVALCTILGFFLLLMTYYGVSFYLVGLHSYAGGHAKPIPPLLIGYLIAELAFLALVGASAFRRRIE